MTLPFVQSLKNNWRELADDEPGKRFQHRYEQKQREGRSAAHLFKMVAAVILIAAGVVLLVIPGPGSVLIVLGGAMLAEGSMSVARALDWTEMRIRRLLLKAGR
jgi:hypothetical protein